MQRGEPLNFSQKRGSLTILGKIDLAVVFVPDFTSIAIPDSHAADNTGECLTFSLRWVLRKRNASINERLRLCECRLDGPLPTVV